MKVLLVNDEPQITECIELTLTHLFNGEVPLTFLIAKDGIEALALYRKERFDLIISDERMPNMCGLEMLQQLREEKDPVPFILTTGSSCSEERLLAAQLGVLRYFEMPFSTTELLGPIRALHLMKLWVK